MAVGPEEARRRVSEKQLRKHLRRVRETIEVNNRILVHLDNPGVQALLLQGRLSPKAQKLATHLDLKRSRLKNSARFAIAGLALTQIHPAIGVGLLGGSAYYAAAAGVSGLLSRGRGREHLYAEILFSKPLRTPAEKHEAGVVSFLDNLRRENSRLEEQKKILEEILKRGKAA